MTTKRAAAVLGVGLFLVGALWVYAQEGTPEQRRERWAKTFQAGNYKDAYEGLRKLALDPADDPQRIGSDLDLAVQALHQLGRIAEADAFREAVIAVHAKNWRLLAAAARSYANDQHFGFLIVGKFERGGHRGGGRFVNTFLRDRTRALQLMQQALRQTQGETNQAAVAQFHLDFAELILDGGGFHAPWRLQYLTDLDKLPDYDDGVFHGDNPGAPVDEQGNPVFHALPKSYETARSDGERWRWNLARAAELAPARQNEAERRFANFLREQFDVQTMLQRFGGEENATEKTGPFAVQTLEEDETIARLAAGIKRFKVPDEFNWIKVYRRIADRGRTDPGSQALGNLASVYENRRQFVQAAATWRRAIEEYGPGGENGRQRRLEQIVGNWGEFEAGRVQPAGQAAIVDFRFRNGKKVTFEAWPIRVGQLLADVKAYLTGNPGQLDGQRMDVSNIGHRLVAQREEKYLEPRAAAWEMDLQPREKHFDRVVTVKTPLEKPGAYLVTAKMAGGNVSRIIVWVSDTVLLKKQLDGQVFCYVADAATGRPVPGASVEFFGWKQIQVQPNQNRYQVLTTSFTETTDNDGQVIVPQTRVPPQHQWLITARQRGTDRLAYVGFTNVWFGRVYDREYSAMRTLAITDRPVYRPEQTVQFKFWLQHAKYDSDTSAFARQPVTVEIRNPKGDKVLEKPYTADEYGGVAGEFFLPKTATLGVYRLFLQGRGGGTFRVEEYKKPEFEVKVEAPSEPVTLGEHIVATIDARYYFGAPVTKAKVKYKVLRSNYSSRWYPGGTWDWLYGPGYWWFAADYAWYPGWQEWGCLRPARWWFGVHQAPPEVVMENEVALGADGKLKIAIDTRPAKELHGNHDHQYTITAEVVDESRRTIVGTGEVLVARKPFQVFTWVDRGYYRTGDDVKASFRAQTLDRKPVPGKGELTLYRVTYENARPVETPVQTWPLDTDAQGQAREQMKAAKPGQYRLSYKVTDAKAHTIEGGYVFVVRGEGFDGSGYRFNDVELVTDRREYQPGEQVRLLVNTEQQNGTVLLFVRPANGVYLPPRVLRLQGKSVEQAIAVVQRDMPNFFIEAVTISGGRIHSDVREVVVPPDKRVLNVEVVPSQQEYKPGQPAKVKVKLTDLQGKPFIGSTVVSIYDKSVEYISGGSNVPEIKAFFWKWRRSHQPQGESSLDRWLGNLQRPGEIAMAPLGAFGAGVIDELGRRTTFTTVGAAVGGQPGAPAPMAPGRPGGFGGPAGPLTSPPTGSFRAEGRAGEPEGEQRREAQLQSDGARLGEPPNLVQPAIRKNFADTAYWNASLTTDRNGEAEIALTMPESLTAWKVKVWALGHGTRVGQGEVEVTTKKDLIVRLQAPRFFVEKDEVVLSANVHNYLKKDKDVKVVLELDGGTLVAQANAVQDVRIAAGGEKRVDWRVKVVNEGEATVRMKALSDEDADAMEMRFPCLVHGMLKTESFTGVIRPDKETAQVALTVPAERRINDTVLEVRYSPSLAGAMVDALPYLADYPYGCTEQTLNRFLPTVVTQKVLLGMKLDLKEIQKHRTNLNAQEIGEAKERFKGWKRFGREPVFDEDEVRNMARAGVEALAGMQLSDGGWGWFSGFGERSWPHTTCVVVHGLQLAQENGVALPAGMLERGIEWLKNYQAEQVRRLQHFPTRTEPFKAFADNQDALVYMTLVDSNVQNVEMMDFLYRDRTHLAVYAKALYGLALYKQQQADKLDMILKNIEQFAVVDPENQTAYLRLPADNPWWYWYGSEIEADAYYLKLLARTNPKDEKASGLVKYLLNNRKHATYWNSTRDTAICVEAFADYLKASGEDQPDMTIEVWLDGKKRKEVKVERSNLFSFDNTLLLAGDAVDTGKHVLEIKRRGSGPVYFNAYLTNFTLEDFITRAGLEVKVNRKYYKLTRVDEKVKVSGARGQALDQKIEKYERTELPNLAELKSGELVEVELEIDSKNDYEYMLFEDPKAAGFEPMLVRSGYTNTGLHAYMELRDEKVCFFVRQLMRGKHSVSYRLRAEIPGRFSALPTRAYAMYAPELRGNSDEIKLRVTD